jgi:AraC family transcriptional regulator
MTDERGPERQPERIEVLQDGQQVPIVPNTPVLVGSGFSDPGIILEKHRIPRPALYRDREMITHIFWVTDSPGIRITGRLDGKAHNLISKRGGLWVLPNSVHQVEQWHGPHAGTLLSITAPAFERQIEGLMYGGRIELKAKKELQDNQTELLMRTLISEIERPLPTETLLAEMLVNAICIRFAKRCASTKLLNEPQRGGLPTIRLKRVQDFIQSHLDEQITLADLAAVAEMSLFHFAKLFKRSTGFSPYRYIRNQRIALAKELLSDPKLKMIDVGLRVGFEHQSNFARAFRQDVGLNPWRFRRDRL